MRFACHQAMLSKLKLVADSNRAQRAKELSPVNRDGLARLQLRDR